MQANLHARMDFAKFGKGGEKRMDGAFVDAQGKFAAFQALQFHKTFFALHRAGSGAALAYSFSRVPASVMRTGLGHEHRGCPKECSSLRMARLTAGWVR